jgi:hypothetical protein
MDKKAVMDQVLDNETQTAEQKDLVSFTQRHGEPSAQPFFQ